jgi:hypothetical protein
VGVRAMNQQERDALRYKHRCLESKVGPWCRSCMGGWPCDTIKVLDATEPAATDCDHVFIANPTNPLSIFPTFPYCPKCGEKL